MLGEWLVIITVYNIEATSWQYIFFLLVRGTGIPVEHHRPAPKHSAPK